MGRRRTASWRRASLATALGGRVAGSRTVGSTLAVASAPQAAYAAAASPRDGGAPVAEDLPQEEGGRERKRLGGAEDGRRPPTRRAGKGADQYLGQLPTRESCGGLGEGPPPTGRGGVMAKESHHGNAFPPVSAPSMAPCSPAPLGVISDTLD